MGVKSLWDLLLTTAIPISLDSLSGQTLAIDASIWLVRASSLQNGSQESQSILVLKCIFKKIIKLLNNNIRPIFVFDGTPPILKRKTLQMRRKRRRQFEANQSEIRKRVEIQVMKAISGKNCKKENHKEQTIEESLKQLNNLYETLSNVQKEQIDNLVEKVQLQGEILNQKYIYFLDIYPQIHSKNFNIQQFSNLDIDQKQQFLRKIQQQTNLLKQHQSNNYLKKDISQQMKVLKNIQIMRKKTKIRQLQDKLYRKMSINKQHQGYQIIQSIYNGKKVIQKRKIQNNNKMDNKSKMKNDLTAILRASQNNDDDDNNRQSSSFFNSIFSKPRIINNNAQEYFLNEKSIKKSIPLSNLEQHQSNSQQDLENQLLKVSKEDLEQSNIKSNQINNQQNQDNFPDYINNQQLPQRNFQQEKSDLQHLLDLLNILYIVAPSQAQAQCAKLEQLGLVDGIITQDSDVFLFGANNVYRGVFQQNIQAYSLKAIEKKLGLNRQKMIIFAMLLGSDYTDGIKGIGIVNAMQIIKIFNNIQKLTKFTKWAKLADVLQDNSQYTTQQILKQSLTQQQKQFYQLHKNYKNYWYISQQFPKTNVTDAYLNPQVLDHLKLQKLSNKLKHGGTINQQSHKNLKQLMKVRFNMEDLQIEHNLKIFSKVYRRQIQLLLDQPTQNFAKIKSLRLKKALG